MNNKRFILFSCFIILFLSLNSLYATSIDDTLSIETGSDMDDSVMESEIHENDNTLNTINKQINEKQYKTLTNEDFNELKNDSTFYVSKGTYNLDSVTINKDISIIGEDSDEVIFIPNGSKSLFTIEKNATVIFKNFTIKDFSSDSDAAITNNGNLIIENLKLLNNVGTSLSNKGGSILNNGELIVSNSTFNENMASWGAAIYNTKNTKVVDSQFNNNAIYNVGGAIYSRNGNLTVLNSNFTENVAVSGAAIYNAAGYMYVNNSIFNENDAEHFFGGAIYSTGITITNNSIFYANHAKIDGGAITNTNNFTIFNCSFQENYANENGGTIENVPWSAKENGNLTIINSSFLENSAGNKGGVIINYGKVEAVGDTAMVTVRNCTFELNSALYGGVIYNEQYLDFQHNVFIDNEAEEGNIIYSDETLIKSIDNNWWGTNNPTSDDIGAMPKNWIILEFTSKTPLIVDLPSTLQVSLNTLNNGKKLNTTLPSRIAKFSFEKTVIPSDTQILDGIINMDIMLLDDSFSVEVDNQQLSIQATGKQSSTITIDKITTPVYKDNVTITGKLTWDDGKIIPNTPLTLKINNNQYTLFTDGEGKYKYTTKTKFVGTNNITVYFEGNEYYKKSTKKSTFNVSKRDCVVSIDEISGVCYKDVVVVSGRFCDVDGVKLVNSRLRVSVNGETFIVKTDKDGFYNYSFAAMTVGLNNISVAYPGNSHYNSNYVNYTFNVSKKDVKVSIDNITNNKENFTIAGKFTDINGAKIINSNVMINFTNNIVYVKTNNKGIYKYTGKITNQTIEFTVGYKGNNNYNSYTSNLTTYVMQA